MGMTEAERIARAHRARAALEEFVGPLLDEIEQTYLKRLREVSTSEYSYKARSDKQTALSCALTILASVRSGLNEAITDGELAKQSKLRAEKIEQMTAPQRRLLNIVPR
jgi:hypothetical protein